MSAGSADSDGTEPKLGGRRFPIFTLALWGVLVFVVPQFVQTLNAFEIFKFPLGYFMNAVGILIALILIAIISALWQGRFDARQGSGK